MTTETEELVQFSVQLPRRVYDQLVAECQRRGCFKRRVILDALVRALTPQPDHAADRPTQVAV